MLHFVFFSSLIYISNIFCLAKSLVVGAMASKKVNYVDVSDASGVPIERSQCIIGGTATPSVVHSDSSSSISSSVEPKPK